MTSDRPQPGSYLVSRFEERWDNWVSCQTRGEAIEYGVMLMEWDSADDGEIFYTGLIAPFTADQLAAAAAVDAEVALDGIEDFMIKSAGDCACVDDSMPTTSAQRADLDRRLQTAVREWLAAHRLTPICHQLVEIQRHVYQQCEQQDVQIAIARSLAELTEPLVAETSRRCLRHRNHQGECAWNR